MKQIVDLKEGMTAKVEGGKLVIEMPEKYTPKKGEFVTCDRNTIGNKWIMIWNGFDRGLSNEFCGYVVNDKRLDMGGNSCLQTETFRPSTKEEQKILISALADKGKRWDAEKMRIVDLEWKPKAGDVVTNQLDGAIFIQKSSYKTGTSFYAALYNGKFYTDGNIGYNSPRLATREERCTFFARLVAEGYKWNAKKLKLTKVEKWVPKDGEFVAHTDESGDTLISIFKRFQADGTVANYAGVGGGPWRDLLIDDWSLAEWADRPATESEIKIMNDALAKAGKRWNAELKRVEDIEAEYKEGDFLRTMGGNVFIYKNTHYGRMFDHAFMFSGGGVTISDGPSCEVGSISRHATEQEKQKLLDGLAKIGKKWNATKKRIEQCRWRAEPGGSYEYVNSYCGRALSADTCDDLAFLHNWRFESGNYYKPGTGQAQKAADKINEIFKSNL